jgi:hypothetical protein
MAIVPFISHKSMIIPISAVRKAGMQLHLSALVYKPIIVIGSQIGGTNIITRRVCWFRVNIELLVVILLIVEVHSLVLFTSKVWEVVLITIVVAFFSLIALFEVGRVL